MTSRLPPRYVPTLTDVVRTSAELRAPPGADPSQEKVVRRVMQRIDLTLERRLREAIAATVIEQTRAITPKLREEIEQVVRETVAQAFADELGAGRRA
ncbi:MAG: hypothetical protein ABIU58_03965 [Ramlibacter sp.]